MKGGETECKLISLEKKKKGEKKDADRDRERKLIRARSWIGDRWALDKWTVNI